MLTSTGGLGYDGIPEPLLNVRGCHELLSEESFSYRLAVLLSPEISSENRLNLLAACAFGLEAIVKRELIALGIEAKVAQPGRIRFSGDWSAVCQTNLWLRTADRVLIEVLQFPAADFDALFDTIKAHDFSELIPHDAAFPVSGKSRLSQLTSVPAIQRTVKKALVESLKTFHRTETLEETGPTFAFEIALLNDVATLTIDTSGPSLHKRGYRRLVAEAPIKETLAAAMIDLSVWKPGRMLVDPFCGSGTIPIEAALIGLNIAPGLHRNFVSSDWPVIPAEVWTDVKESALKAIKKDQPLQIYGFDRDPEVLKLARVHAEKAGVASYIDFQQRDFEALRSDAEYGCVITNPPYGERLEDQKSLEGLYLSIPGVIQRLPTWSLFLITNMPKFEKMIEKRATRRRKLYNGRLECTYYQYLGPRPPKDFASQPDQATNFNNDAGSKVEPGFIEKHDSGDIVTPPEPTTTVVGSPPYEAPSPSRQSAAPAPLFAGLESKDHEQAGLFKSRLTKLARHLRRWPTKRGITCYRLYEKDIPEIPLVVDRYEDYLHITEYERPHERSLARHAAWLELMKETAAEALGVKVENVFLKQRLKNHDLSQYEKFGDSGRLITVHESGLDFLVNLSDYVDTGLFLDHRATRQMVHDEARDTDFLNLFAYTGSFSVYAAAGGARSTTTVDLSKNYLSWAEKNFSANGLSGHQHRFVPADAMEFLKATARDPRRRFDLAVVDPPTYSNSKRTEEDWDVQQNHVQLLNELHGVMRTGSVVYFSTNFRRFKLAESELTGFEIREISKQTVPEDFRNRRIHRCWRLVVR